MLIDGAPFTRILVIDFETAWCSKSGYTLSKLTNEEYVRDPRFHAWGLCWRDLGTDKTTWVRHEDIAAWVASIDWNTTAVLAHNAQFDCSVLCWVYGARPVFILDSLSMARALRSIEVGNSLAKLADAYGLPPKGKAVHSTDGVLKPQALDALVERELADYCAHDVWLCEQIFSKLYIRLDPLSSEIRGTFPLKELKLIDMTLKMYLFPHLELDSAMLAEAIQDEKTKREGLLARLGIPEKHLASNLKFADALKSLGVEPPTKTSKTTGKETLALSKTDALFQALVNGSREDVALLCEARLAVKSTQSRTRAQRFLEIAGRGRLPVPLSYYGAHTGRWTAAKGSAINMQNLKRGSFLRNAILAPAGHDIVVGDLSQIEPRVLAWLADYHEQLEIFRIGKDAYAAFGAQMFNIPGLTKESHPLLRQSAKSALLGCGFGIGWQSFSAQLMAGFMGADPVTYDKKFAKQAGVTGEHIEKFIGWEENLVKMAAVPHTCSEEELLIHCVATKAIIDKYRTAAYTVTALWDFFHSLIERSLYDGEEVTYKCLTFKKEEIVLPNGMSLRYPGLKKHVVQKNNKYQTEWTYGEKTKLYGGKITENVVQALARIVMTDGMLRVQKRYFVAGTVHDELLAIVPSREAAEAEAWVKEKMIVVPPWMPGIPLSAGTGYAKRYGEAKD